MLGLHEVSTTWQEYRQHPSHPQRLVQVQCLKTSSPQGLQNSTWHRSQVWALVTFEMYDSLPQSSTAFTANQYVRYAARPVTVAV